MPLSSISRSQNALVETVKPSDYLDRFCKNLAFSQVGTRLAQHMGKIASDKDQEKQWDGKSPVSIAGGILWFVTQISTEDSSISLNTISSHTGASSSAIRSALVTIKQEADSMIPVWWTDMQAVKKEEP